jgi:hypothetical protein
MNDEKAQTTSAEANEAVWATYDPELKAAIVAKDPVAERLYRAEAQLEELRRQNGGQP